MTSGGPPAWMERLLGRLITRPSVRRDVLGSLRVEHAGIAARSGRAKADRWYVRQGLGVAWRAVLGRLGRGSADPAPGWAMTSLLSDLRYGARSFLRAPGLSAVVVLTLALGVGANTAVFSVLNGVLLKPLPYPDADQLVAVWPEKRWSVPMAEDVAEAVDSYEHLALYDGTDLTLFGGAVPELVEAIRVSHAWFDVLGLQAELGRTFTEGDAVAETGPVAVLSHSAWIRRFGGDSGVIGRSVELAGQGAERRTVVGVMPADFVPLGNTGAEVFIPLVEEPGVPGYWDGYGFSAVARLAEGVSPEQATERMRGIIPELTPVHPTQFRESRYSPVDVVPLLDTMVRDVRPRLLVLLGAVGFVLLIACANVGNLLLARGMGRRREMGLRIALGAGRGRIVRQMLVESAFLGLVGGLVGIAAAVLLLTVLTGQLADQLPRVSFIELDGRVLLFATTLSLVSGLVFGVAPAVAASRQLPGSALSDDARGASTGRRGVRLNEGLVVAEVALALILVVGAGLMMKSLWRLSRVEPGFQTEQILTLRTVVPPGRYDSDPARDALATSLLEAVRAVPGVRSAAFTITLPLTGDWLGLPYRVEGQDLPEGTPSQVVSIRVVTPAFFELLDLAPLQGRTLTEEDGPEGEAAIVANRSFVRQHFGDENPLGRRILRSSGDTLGSIVGVVEDVRLEDVSLAPRPELYVSAPAIGWYAEYLLVGTSLPPEQLRRGVTEAVHTVDPNLPVREVRPLDEVIRESMGDSRFYARLFGIFAALALSLGLIGVYGVMAYSVGQRTREIGIRKALGATTETVMGRVLGQALRPVVGGVVLGLLGAFVLSRVLEGLLYEVPATDPWVYVAVALMLLAAGTAAGLIPAGRASRLEPVESLRTE